MTNASDRLDLARRIRGRWESCLGSFAGRTAREVEFVDEDGDGLGMVRARRDDGRLVFETSYTVIDAVHVDFECGEACSYPNFFRVSDDGEYLIPRLT